VDITAAELAAKIGAELEGDGACRVASVAGVREAGPGDVTFVALPKYAPLAASTRASVVVLPVDWDKPCPAPARLRVAKPEEAFARIALMFAPPAISIKPGIHPTAVIAPDAVLGRDVYIGPGCVVEPGARIGDGTVLVAQVYVGHGATIGSDSKLYPLVSLREHVRIGDRVIIHNGTVVGSDGFGYNVDAQGVRTKIPQIGIVIIGDDVEIGANVTIDRARFGRTEIRKGAKIDNLVQIAHNVIIGENAVIVAQVGIAGSSQIGARAVLAGQVGVAGHIVVGEGSTVGAQSGVPQDVPPNSFVLGSPAIPAEDEKRRIFSVMRLPKLKEKVAELDKRLKELEKKLQS